MVGVESVQEVDDWISLPEIPGIARWEINRRQSLIRIAEEVISKRWRGNRVDVCDSAALCKDRSWNQKRNGEQK